MLLRITAVPVPRTEIQSRTVRLPVGRGTMATDDFVRYASS